MFEKLLSVLPYNPGLLHQMSFYSQRMREEAAIRRTGLIFVVLAFMVQFFTVLAPPQLASAGVNTNDMIDPGIDGFALSAAHPRTDAYNACHDNVRGYGDALATFGVSCASILKADVIDVNSDSVNSDGPLYSMGYHSYGQTNPNTGKATDQHEFTVQNSGKIIYARKLSSFDTGSKSTYVHSLRLFSSTGQKVFILSTCGNLVTYGLPKMPPPVDHCPNKPGLQDSDDNCDVCPNRAGVQLTDSQCDACPLRDGVQNSTADCDVCPNIPGVQNSDNNCDVCPAVPGVQTDTTQCITCATNPTQETCDKCPGIAGVQTRADQCDVCPDRAGIQLSLSECDKCANKPGIQGDSDNCDVCPDNPGVQLSPDDCFVVCKYNASLTSTDVNCKPCDASVSSEDTLACITIHKTASNVTAGLANADGTTAKPGDTIVYTLYAENKGKAAVSQFSFQEDMADVLDYADIVDLHGGTLGANKVITWPLESIAAGATASHQVTVKVKDPVPATPVDPSDSSHFDLIMTNVYGNAVNIKVTPPPAKAIETAAAQLPNTGPGTTMFMAASVIVITGYFYGRARLLAREAALAIQENSGV